ncbi:calponin homology domain-containing protein DDB_G0272472-like isoform X3 [Apis dorsata]|uniref:calponin homology domain-containing protein DDB_G0272472-like isoform X3 n=1 Tax=Apis dorsata TaxID=7462 RepID=UPI00129366B4|nr:calponin homology domain-containing protein DDB_G0272472-like isoform X3 [Apis dorsata]
MAEITDFGPRKTIFILAIVAGCFAVLWPKIFYPMLTASVNPHHMTDNSDTIKQERRTPPHAGGLHPALRERGRAIPSSHIVPKVSDRPDHVVPKMRPPLGGAGHVVPAPKGSGTMGIIMPLYTLGIVLFFLYTIVKVLRKNSDSEIISEYPGAAAEKEFRKMVFSPEAFATAMTGGTMNYQKERSPSPQRPTPTLEELKDQAAGDIEIDQLRRRLVETEAAMERIVVQMGNISRSVMHSPNPQQEFKDNTIAQVQYSTADKVENIEHSPTIKVMGMEMTASCENKGSRPTTPIIPISPSHIEREKTPPKPIYLEGALPPQCELLVTDSETQAQKAEEDVEAPIVLSGKMTLSLISLDQNTAEIDEEDQEKNAKNIRILNSKDTAKVLSIKKNNKEEIENKDEIKEIYQGKQIEIEEEEQKKYLIQKRTEIKPIGYNEEKEKEEVQGVEETKEIEEIEEIEEDKEEVEQSEDEKKEEENDKAEIDRDDEENDKKINKIEQYNERSEEEVDKKEEEDEEEKEEEDEEEKEEKDEEEKEEKTEGRLEENEKEKENNNKNI